MGSLPISHLQTGPRSDSKTELIRRILDRTRENKIHWVRSGRMYAGQTLDGVIKAELMLASSLLGIGSWSRFSVKSRNKELLDVENGVTLLTLAGADRSPAKQLIGELASLLEERESQDVRDAIMALDKL